MAGIEEKDFMMAGGSLKVKANLELIRGPGGKFKYMNPSYKRVQQKMYDYKCDVKLKVGTENFHAHKDVLSEASDYFAAMFTVDMKEKDQEHIEIHEISPKGFSSLLEYFYHGHITITSDLVEDMLEAARFFQVDWLLEAVSDFLVRHLSMENYYEVLDLCDKYVLGDLRANIFSHIGQNFQRIMKERQLHNLSFELFHQLLSEDYFIDATEDKILQVVLDWLAFKEERKEYIAQMMKCIKFRLVDPKAIRHIPEFIRENEEARAFIEKADIYHNDISGQCLVDPSLTSARGSQMVIALLPIDDTTTYVQYKVPGDSQFFSQKTDIQELDCSLECASLACLGNFLFVVGGYTRNFVSSRATYRYDPRTITWIQLTDMNHSRVSFALCAGSQSLFAAGGVELLLLDGRENEIFLETTECYQPNTNQWIEMPSLPFKCYNLAMTDVNGTMYVCGGVTDNPEEMIPINYTLSYRPGDEVWTPRAPMLIGRQGHSMTTLNNKIFVLGGSCAYSEVTHGDCLNNEVYDVETDQWTSISSLPPGSGRAGNTAVLFENKYIYFISGTFASRFLIYYDTENDEFSEKEYCGVHPQKIAPLIIGMPKDFHEALDESRNDQSADC